MSNGHQKLAHECNPAQISQMVFKSTAAMGMAKAQSLSVLCLEQMKQQYSVASDALTWHLTLQWTQLFYSQAFDMPFVQPNVSNNLTVHLICFVKLSKRSSNTTEGQQTA